MIYKAISAHNAFTTKIVSNLGFDFVWASSLEVSTSFCLPDASIVTFDTIKSVVEHMVRVSAKPIIVDCDSGYGNEVNTLYALKDLKKIGVHAICIEDNIFPKQNSFYEGTRKLEDKDVFCNKIRIAKKIFNDNNDIIIARTEALIQGMSQREALNRSLAYIKSGANYILPHSKKTNVNELLTFARSWNKYAPIVAVPSTYSSATAKELEEAGVKIVIYANHTIRTIKKALETTLPKILISGRTHEIEGEISPLKEILKYYEN